MPFGRSTIRRFTHDVADLKKLAARDFEDILQVCRPHTIRSYVRNDLLTFLSAASHALKDYCPSRTTIRPLIFCILPCIGIRLLSYGFTRKPHSPSSTTSPSSSRSRFATLLESLAHHLTLSRLIANTMQGAGQLIAGDPVKTAQQLCLLALAVSGQKHLI